MGEEGSCEPRYPGGSSDVLADGVNVKFTEHMPSVIKTRKDVQLVFDFLVGGEAHQKIIIVHQQMNG